MQLPIMPYVIKLGPEDFPKIIETFIELAGKKEIEEGLLPKQHKFYNAVSFYLRHKESNWATLNLPGFILEAVKNMINFWLLQGFLKNFMQKGSFKRLLNAGEIDTLCVEAMVLSNYVKKGCPFRWLSILHEDPPDLVIHDPISKTAVDIEVKIKAEEFSLKTEAQAIKGIFESLSKGLQSLKDRKNYDNPAVIAIHAPKDLEWEKWVDNRDVHQRLSSRLEHPDYEMVSGVIFSGGDLEIKITPTETYCGSRLVCFRSHSAKHQLPTGFLPTFSGEL